MSPRRSPGIGELSLSLPGTQYDFPPFQTTTSPAATFSLPLADALLDALDEGHRWAGEESRPVPLAELAHPLGRHLGRVPANLAQARRPERPFHGPHAEV